MCAEWTSLYYLAQGSSQEKREKLNSQMVGTNMQVSSGCCQPDHSAPAIWSSWVIICFPIVWFSSLRHLPLGQRTTGTLMSKPHSVACNEGKGDPKRRMRELGRRETRKSPYIALIRMWAPQRQNPWLSLLHVCGSTQENYAVNQSMISFFSQKAEFVFSSLFWFVSLSFESSWKAWVLKTDRPGMEFQLH